MSGSTVLYCACNLGPLLHLLEPVALVARYNYFLIWYIETRQSLISDLMFRRWSPLRKWWPRIRLCGSGFTLSLPTLEVVHTYIFAELLWILLDFLVWSNGQVTSEHVDAIISAGTCSLWPNRWTGGRSHCSTQIASPPCASHSELVDGSQCRSLVCSSQASCFTLRSSRRQPFTFMVYFWTSALSCFIRVQYTVYLYTRNQFTIGLV